MAERRRLPPALAALLGVSLLLSVTWAALVPAFQAPDEQAHFAYVQTLGERFVLPGDPARPIFSTEVSQAMTALNSNQVASQRPVKPEWGEGIERRWEQTQAAAPDDDGGGPGPGSSYPPTAYAWATLGYLAGSSGSVFDTLLGARLMSALWVPLTVFATWLLAGEVFGRRRLLQTAAAAVPALAPMVTFVSASVSPDGMLFAIWTLALWLGVRCVRRGVPLADGAAFFALVGLACTIKTTSYGLFAPALLVAVLGILARRLLRAPSLVRFAGAIVLPLTLTLGIWLVAAAAENRTAAASLGESTASTSGTNWRELLSYVWQYYLPRTPIQNDYRIPPGGYPLLQVWITQGWAAFGWLEVKFAPWVYRVLAVVTAAVGLAAGAALWRARRSLDLRVGGFLAVAVLTLLAGLHWTDYHQLEAGSMGFMQGRYLLPIVGVLALAPAAAISLVPAARRGIATGATVAALLVFHLFAIGLMLERFYA